MNHTTICHITLSNKLKLSRWTEMNERSFLQSKIMQMIFHLHFSRLLFIQAICQVAKKSVFASFTLLSVSSCIFVNRHFCQSMKISLQKKLFSSKKGQEKFDSSTTQCLKIILKVSIFDQLKSFTLLQERQIIKKIDLKKFRMATQII